MIMIIGHVCIWRYVCGGVLGGEGKEKEMFERVGKKERGNENVIEGVNLFKVHCKELSQ
jgi:hypothetical protein